MSSFSGASGCRCNRPGAVAVIKGSPKYPDIRGRVLFFPKCHGVLVVADIWHLPDSGDPCKGAIHALHIHEGGCCTGTQEKPFADVGAHFNPNGCPHPYHAGDLPPLFAHHGHAYSAVLTGRFTLEQIIGRSVIIHSGVDDFTTQPSGNAGEMIACGGIRAWRAPGR
nr:superoxide dismutase family protein [bacterium]